MSLLAGRAKLLGVLLLAFDSALFSCGFEFFVSGREDGGMAACQAIGGRDIAGARVQASIVIMIDEVGDHAFGVLQRERGFGSDGLLFESAMIAFEFAVALRVMG